MKKILEKKNDPLKGGQVKLATFVHFFLDLKNEDRIRGNGEMCEPKSGNQGLQAPVCACIPYLAHKEYFQKLISYVTVKQIKL